VERQKGGNSGEEQNPKKEVDDIGPSQGEKPERERYIYIYIYLYFIFSYISTFAFSAPSTIQPYAASGTASCESIFPLFESLPTAAIQRGKRCPVQYISSYILLGRQRC